MSSEIPAVSTKIHQLIPTLYGKSCSQLFISHHATGKATRDAMSTGLRKFFESITTISPAPAPSTLRMPISRVRCSALKAASQNRPRLPTKTAMTVKIQRSVLSFSSL